MMVENIEESEPSFQIRLSGFNQRGLPGAMGSVDYIFVLWELDSEGRGEPGRTVMHHAQLHRHVDAASPFNISASESITILLACDMFLAALS